LSFIFKIIIFLLTGFLFHLSCNFYFLFFFSSVWTQHKRALIVLNVSYIPVFLIVCFISSFCYGLHCNTLDSSVWTLYQLSFLWQTNSNFGLSNDFVKSTKSNQLQLSVPAIRKTKKRTTFRNLLYRTLKKQLIIFYFKTNINKKKKLKNLQKQNKKQCFNFMALHCFFFYILNNQICQSLKFKCKSWK